LQNLVDELGARSVHFFGFQNRNRIADYYAISDVLVLPSVRETWGIVINEAMCFGLPVIVSYQVGAGIDLVTDGHNGYRVATDVDSLSRSIKRIADLTEEERLLMGMKSIETIKEWSHRDLAGSLIQYIESVRDRKPSKKARDSTCG
jgi:glycosyltransferase involved in cell wall biosynthesis